MGTMAMLWPILDSNKQTLDYTEQDIKEAARAFYATRALRAHAAA